jgi:hypothetical protein
MARSRVEFRLPPDEKQQIRASAAHHGLSLSLYLRALALADREAQERAEMMQRIYPNSPSVAREGAARPCLSPARPLVHLPRSR